MERRLAAILAADVVGYSKLMSENEAGTLADLLQHREHTFDPEIAKRGGRIVKLMGDGTLVEFSSVVAAVECAMAIQTAMAHDQDNRFQLRIGINLGDVIIEGADIYGDGVNIAARLEALAEPGGLCVSSIVHESLGNRVNATFSDAGTHELKNIDQPVHVWRWTATQEQSVDPAVAKASQQPANSSIAVLAFDNMSNDPEQDYFADGIVEDIITELSRFSQLFVIARNSTFVYKGRSVDVRQIAAELNVRYVLEGSVRKSGDRVRITGQLIDAESGGHVWADRYEGELTDVFVLQDRITEAVVSVIEPAIRRSDLERARRKNPENMDAYDLYLQALPFAYARNKTECAKAFELLEKSIGYDPNFVPSLALSVWCLEQGITLGWPELTGDDREIAMDRARTVLSMNTEDANAIAMAGFCLQMIGHDFEGGRTAALRALKLNPNSVIVQTFSGLTLVFWGDAELARSCFDRAMTLSPADPGIAFFLLGLAMVHLSSGHYEEAIEASLQSAALNPRETVYWCLAAAYASLDRKAEVASTLDKLLAINPAANDVHYWENLPFRDTKIRAALARVLSLPKSA